MSDDRNRKLGERISSHTLFVLVSLTAAVCGILGISILGGIPHAKPSTSDVRTPPPTIPEPATVKLSPPPTVTAPKPSPVAPASVPGLGETKTEAADTAGGDARSGNDRPAKRAEEAASAPTEKNFPLAPTQGLASAVSITTLQPNDLHLLNSTKNGFRAVLTLTPGAGQAPRLLLPLKGGRIGPFFRLQTAVGSTSQGVSCSGWTSADEFPVRYWIETDSVPAPEQWSELTGPTTLILSYWCDAPLAAGDTVTFSFSLYVSGTKSSWSSEAVPVRSDRGRLTG